MEIKLQKILEHQKKINENIEASVDQFIVGFNIKLFRFFDEIGYWGWEKRNAWFDDLMDNLVAMLQMFNSIIIAAEKSNLAKNKEMPNYELELNSIIEALIKTNEEHPLERETLIKNWIILIGTDNETQQTLSTIQRMAIAIYLLYLIVPEAFWEDLEKTYLSHEGFI